MMKEVRSAGPAPALDVAHRAYDAATEVSDAS
jgi:hypothetical protein